MEVVVDLVPFIIYIRKDREKKSLTIEGKSRSHNKRFSEACDLEIIE